jgi:hypothetical protein
VDDRFRRDDFCDVRHRTLSGWLPAVHASHEALNWACRVDAQSPVVVFPSTGTPSLLPFTLDILVKWDNSLGREGSLECLVERIARSKFCRAV